MIVILVKKGGLTLHESLCINIEVVVEYMNNHKLAVNILITQLILFPRDTRMEYKL